MVLCFNKYFQEWEELWNRLVRDNALAKAVSGNLNCMDPGLGGRRGRAVRDRGRQVQPCGGRKFGEIVISGYMEAEL